MNPFEEKLLTFINSHQLKAELLRFDQSCHSVAEAAAAVGTSPENLVKNICLLDEENHLIVAIVKGEDRVSAAEIGNALHIPPPRIATPEEIIEKSGFPCGGVPSFGFTARFLIDPRVMEMPFVYTGGGSANALVRIETRELLRANQGQVVKIRR